MKASLLCFGLLTLLSGNVVNARHPGVDPLFGSAGIASIPGNALGLSASSWYGFAGITSAPADGGRSYVFASNYQNYVLSRLGPNGELDSTFGNGGVVEGTFVKALARPMV